MNCFQNVKYGVCRAIPKHQSLGAMKIGMKCSA